MWNIFFLEMFQEYLGCGDSVDNPQNAGGTITFIFQGFFRKKSSKIASSNFSSKTKDV